VTEAGKENRQRARLVFGSPSLAQVEQWANQQIDDFDPERIFDRNDYINAFLTLHEVLEDARVEHLYVQKYPEAATAFAALAEREVAAYEGENPVGEFKYVLTRPYVSASLREELQKAYLEFFDEEDLESLIAIFESFRGLDDRDTSEARKHLVHDLIFYDTPGVIGLGFDSGDGRQWEFTGELDLSSASAQESFCSFVQAAVSKFKDEGTVDTGDVLAVLFDAETDDVWGGPGLRLLASAKAGKVYGSLSGFDLTDAAVASLKTAGWEIIREEDPDRFATREWWTRQADEIATETLWITEDIAGVSDGTVRIVGSDPAREAWQEITGAD
jgi:hypothetical protein